jgi:hypothetical protein
MQNKTLMAFTDDELTVLHRNYCQGLQSGRAEVKAKLYDTIKEAYLLMLQGKRVTIEGTDNGRQDNIVPANSDVRSEGEDRASSNPERPQERVANKA